VPRKPAGSKSIDLYALGARVTSVFGAFQSRVLIEMPAEAAQELFPEPFGESGWMSVIEAAEREVEAIRKRDAALADSALAASAIALAYEIANPYNSATSKSMCAREMRDTLDRLRELAPEERKADDLDDLAARRAKRLADTG
jgi:DNA-binding IclR family transcriptional regulator